MPVCVKGYHLINSEPINETTWETINEQVLTLSGYTVHHTSKGSHAPGCDIQSSFGTLSNKSAKYDKLKTNFSISSYRLTTVCSDKNCGNIQDILLEINRRKNFQFYSFLVRHENQNETQNNDYDTILYHWYVIPADHPSLDPLSYTWEPMLATRGHKNGTQTGWKTNSIDGHKMNITFSMSSQLWIQLPNHPTLVFPDQKY